jgi:hypothetical protein
LAGSRPRKKRTDLKLVLSPFAATSVVGNPEVIPPIFRKILAAAVGRTGRSVPVLFQFANPNIAVADRVVVVLQSEASAVTKGTHLSSATRLHSDRRDTELNL